MLRVEAVCQPVSMGGVLELESYPFANIVVVGPESSAAATSKGKI